MAAQFAGPDAALTAAPTASASRRKVACSELTYPLGSKERIRGWATRARLRCSAAPTSAAASGTCSQYPDLLTDNLSLDDAAGARPTLLGVVVTFGLAAVTAAPAMLWLFVLVNRRDWATDKH